MLILLDGLLIAAATWSSVEALRLVKAPREDILRAISRLQIALILLLAGATIIARHEHAIQPHSSTWWQLVVGAFVVGFGFWVHRNRLNEVLEQLADSAGR